MMAGLILILLIVWGAIGAVGGWISVQRGRSWFSGFLLGFFLNGVGLIIAALLPRPIEFQVHERMIVEQAVSQYRGQSNSRQLGSERRVNGPVPKHLAGIFEALEGPSSTGTPRALTPSRRVSRWNECFDAIERSSDDRQGPLESAARELCARFNGLRAWFLARDETGTPMMLLMFDESVLEVKCQEGQSPSVYYLYPNGGVRLVIAPSVDVGAHRIGIGRDATSVRDQLHWLWEPVPLDAVQNALEFAGASSWFEVSTEAPTVDAGLEVSTEPALPSGRGVGDDGEGEEDESTTALTSKTDLTSVREKLELLQGLRSENLIDDDEYARRTGWILDQATNTKSQ
jgi:hypothetical protein